jgi:methylmalonyl-CoA/ethylmalonyl-CoA epimerase
MKMLNLDHVAFVVADLDAAVDWYRVRYRVEPLYRETMDAEGVEEAWIPIGGSFVKLVQPLGPETPIGRHVSNEGAGFHHVGFAVVSIEAALDHLTSVGAELVDGEPRLGSRGDRIVLVDPGGPTGTLIELVELSDE